MEQMQTALEGRAKQAEDRAAETSAQASKAIGVLEGHLKAADRRARERVAELEAEVEALRTERGRMKEVHAAAAGQLQEDLEQTRRQLRQSKAACEQLEHRVAGMSKAKRDVEAELARAVQAATEAQEAASEKSRRSAEIRLAALSTHPRARLMAMAFGAWRYGPVITVVTAAASPSKLSLASARK